MEDIPGPGGQQKGMSSLSLAAKKMTEEDADSVEDDTEHGSQSSLVLNMLYCGPWKNLGICHTCFLLRMGTTTYDHTRSCRAG